MRGALITDLDEARRVFEAEYAPNRLSSSGRIALRVSTAALPLLDVGDVSIDGSLRMEAPAPRTCYVVLRPRRGGVTVSGCRAVPGTLVVLPPGPTLHYEDWGPASEFTTLRVEESVFTAHGPVVVGHAAPRPTQPVLVNLHDDEARPLAWAMSLLARELRRPSGALEHHAVAESLAATTLSGMLLSLSPASPPDTAHGRVVRRARAAAEGDDGAFLTLTGLARAAAVSVRTLQDAFRTELQTTPSEYLRRQRLARAHRDLARGDYAGTTAEAVAHRWGFTNYGRFTRLYRSVYGVSPLSTLRGSTSRG